MRRNYVSARNETSSRSSELLKACWSILRLNPKLMVFPAITSGATLFAALFFLIPAAVSYKAAHPTEFQSWWHFLRIISHLTEAIPAFGSFAQHSGRDAAFAGLYLLGMFLATFFNVAFYHEILAALSGEGVSVRRGLLAACARIKSILLWSLFAGAVGLVIRTLEKRFDFVGRLLSGWFGLAWSVASVFSIPVLLRMPEGSSPFQVLGNSARTLKQTWGVALAGFVGIAAFGVIFILLTLVGIPTVFELAHIGGSHVWIYGGALWVASLLLLSWASGMADSMYRCALYVYATEGVIPDGFAQEDMDGAWRMRK